MTAAQRQHALALMQMLKRYAGLFGYPPGDRRQQLDAYDWGLSEARLETLFMQGHRAELDCSATASWIYACAGAWPRSRGPGYTGTWLALGLKRYTDGRAAGLAAPVVFGLDREPTGEHMGLVWQPDPHGGDPLVGQHGRPGFDVLSLSETAAGFRGSYTFLNVSRL